jgi:predicted dehydrogenase
VTDEWKKNRSLLSDHFGHEIDILRFLLGEDNLRMLKHSDSYDFYEVSGSAERDGETAYNFRFMGSRALPESVYRESMRLDFDKGALFININDGEVLELPSGKRLPRCPEMDYVVRFQAVNSNFIQAITGKAMPYSSHDDMRCNNSLSVRLDRDGAAFWPF